MFRRTAPDARHVTLARLLHNRLYVDCRGRIFALGGRVAHDQLKQTLAHYARCPTAAEAPSPHSLVQNCEGELSQALSHSIGCALSRWRKQLSLEARRKPAKRRTASVLTREHQEIETLTSRLADLRTWQEKLASGREPAGAPFFLDSGAEAAYQAALEHARRRHPLSPLIAWQARVVCWLSGNCAVSRFLTATTRLLDAYPKPSRLQQVHSFQQAVIVWKRRSGREPVRHLRQELAERFERLPREIVRLGQLSTRLRGRTFPAHCDQLLKRCSQLSADTRRHRWQIVPAALAALVATDDSTTPLPERRLRAAAEAEDDARLLRMIQWLAEQVGQPGYDALLAAIDQLPDSLDELDLTELRKLLAQGNSLAECIWAYERDLQYCFAGSNLSVSAARRLSEAFAKRGCPMSNEDLGSLVARVRRTEDLEPVHTWLAWLGSVSPRTITPRLRQVLRAAFWDRYLVSAQQRGWFEPVAACLATARRAKDRGNAEPLLERIAAHQQTAGKPETLPKSLRKLVDMHERRRREREVLCARQEAGALDRAAAARLQHLESDGGGFPATKIRRAAEERFLLLGIERLRSVTHDLAQATCREHLGHCAALVAPDQYWHFARWIDAMSDADHHRLRELIAAHDRHGRGYKRHLAANRPWLRRALARGFDLSGWLDAEPQHTVLGGRTMEITSVADPRHVFLMGS